MFEPTCTTWILGVVGVIIYLPAVYIQISALCRPHARKTKDMLISKGGEYNDQTHIDFCRGSAWGDLAVQIPLVLVGCIGVLFGQAWAYILWCAGACITIYIHIVLLFLEGRHIWTKWGPLAFFSYGWGLWVYWAVIVVVYCIVRATHAYG